MKFKNFKGYLKIKKYKIKKLQIKIKNKYKKYKI